MDTPEMIAIDTHAMPWEERYQEWAGKSNFRKMLLQDPDTGMEIFMVRYPAGFTTIWHTHPCAHGMYVLEGTLVTHAGSFGPGGFVWFPEGMLMEHGATADRDVVCLFITNKAFEIDFVDHIASNASTPEMITVDTHAMPWEERYQEWAGKSNFRKLLLQDPDTGMEIRMTRYPAGFTTRWHTHPCAHGMYVLDGTLVTHAGSFGPGGFVWFPEGMLMEHGATPDHDVVCLFITNKKFEINFVDKA